MKKLLTFFILCAVLTLAGCGVKSELVRPGDTFPRDYPIY
ncbi:MAG: lipoprotein [Alphaproteobacteria bacterium]|nr:lipoprotein [Alphaproteobacteria bacterium]